MCCSHPSFLFYIHFLILQRVLMFCPCVPVNQSQQATAHTHIPQYQSCSWQYIWRFSTAWYGTVRYGTVHFWGVFHWVLYLVPDTFLVPLRSRFHANRTVTKTWRVNSADHWLAGENRHYCVTELATRDPPLQSYPLDLNQHSQRRIGRNFCLNKRTFLHQPQNSSVVVCWGSSDVPLVDSRGADPVRALWCDAEGKSLTYNVTFELAIFSEYVFCLYFYLCICVLLQLKTIWSNKCTSRLLNMYHCMST